MDGEARITTGPAEGGPSSISPWLIALAVMSATIMEVLDTSVANVALPHIAGSMDSTVEEATWVLTTYLVANAIVIPATAWLSARFGRKRYLLFSVALFTIASALCGLAPSLNMLLFFRVLQGLGGGGLQPLARSILLESFAPEERGKAMAVYGMGIIVAPIIGPALGGWITDSYSWRWIFLINVPIGLAGLWLIRSYVWDPSYLKRIQAQPIDYLGFLLSAAWIGALQIMLDKGQEADWFGAVWIRWTALAAAVAFAAFVYRELTSEHPFLDLRLLRDRNLALSCGLTVVLFVALYGTTVLLPLFLQDLMGYTAFLAGLALSPRGLGSLASMVVVGWLTKKVDERWLGVFGFVVLTLSSWWLADIDLQMSIKNIIWPLMVTGFAMGFLFVPLTTLSVSTLRVEEINMATAIYALTRNVGGAAGISAAATLIQRRSQIHQVMLAAHLTPESPMLRRFLSAVGAMLGRTDGSYLGMRQTLEMLNRQLQTQANLLAYVDVLRLVAIVCLVSTPVFFFFKKPAYAQKRPGAGSLGE